MTDTIRPTREEWVALAEPHWQRGDDWPKREDCTPFNGSLLLDIVKWAEVSHETNHHRRDADAEEVIPGWGTWQQEDWVSSLDENRHGCDTAFCIAGQAAHQGGWGLNGGSIAYPQPLGLRPTAEQLSTWTSVRYAAVYELGITNDEAERLFSGGNTLWDVKSVTGDIFTARGLPDPFAEPV